MANPQEDAQNWINTYANLQRIKHAADREKEIDYQLRIAKVQLETRGIHTESLDMEPSENNP